MLPPELGTFTSAPTTISAHMLLHRNPAYPNEMLFIIRLEEPWGCSFTRKNGADTGGRRPWGGCDAIEVVFEA